MESTASCKLLLALLLLQALLAVRGRSSGGGGGGSISSLEAPRGCSWRRSGGEEASPHPQNSLVCRLRNIASAVSLLGNLSSLQAESVSSLQLQCSEQQPLLFEGQLEAGFLAALPRLERLELENCRLRNLPAGAFASARVLRRLAIHGHAGADWAALGSAELHRDALRGLPELAELELVESNVWSLPSEFLCPAAGLRVLNLTRNRLQDLGSLGLAEPTSANCARSLESLDLGGNELSALPDNGLAGLRELGTLRLQGNAIAAVGDHALAGLHRLRSLDLSGNRLVALPPELLAKTRELRELALGNNSLSVLAPGLLDNLPQLQSLDLSRNELTSRWINRQTFARLGKLAVLDLSHNGLSKIDAQLFRALGQLQVLNLEHNQIESLADECFGSLGNLRSLSLSHNKLARFEAAHSLGLALLDQLFLDDNQLHFVHHAAFRNLSRLQDLRLSGNGLASVPEAVRELRDLKTLDLGNNRITEIQPDSFVGLAKLSGLRLVDNKLENVSRKAFASLPALQILNLASNAIRHVEPAAFSRNSLLIAIRLDGNQLTEIHGLFRDLPTLLMLNISDNKLLWFNYGDLPASLEWLDMHSNQISELSSDFSAGGGSGGLGDLRVKILDASFNRIEEIAESSLPNSLEKLYLNNNRIRTVAPATFMQKTNLLRVALQSNEIRHLDAAAIELQPVPSERELPQFFIGDNPLLCDCTMEWLLRINELSRSRQHPRVLDLAEVSCDMVHARASPKRPLLSLKPKDFVCRYQSHCFAICHCCDFDACDCEMTCPDNCSCYHDHSWSSNVVDCSNAGYRFVPERIPMDATEIYLDGNELGELGSHLFIGKRKLEVLFLNNSGISGLHNRTFNGAESLRVLHLESNALRELKGFEFEQLEQLHELYLDHNAIAQVANSTFRKMKNLELLRLNNNRIVDFRPWEAVSNQQASVSLEGNAWSCDCANAVRLRTWLSEQRAQELAERMYCRDGVETIAQAIQRCTADPSTEAVSIGIHNTPLIGGNFVPMLAGALVVIIAVCLFVALGFAFRQDVRLWAHARYGLRLGKLSSGPRTEEEHDRMFDGYVVCSERDEDFVSRCLAPELEQTGLTLCLQWRDLASTRPLDALIPGAAAAKRIIIALSPVFLANEWQQPEFRAALRAALDNIRPASRRRRVIILLAADVSSRDPELQLLLQTCSIIVWNEKRFWEKLRFAMPDSPDGGGAATGSGKRKPGQHQHHHHHHQQQQHHHQQQQQQRLAEQRIPARYGTTPTVLVDTWASKPATASGSASLHPQHRHPGPAHHQPQQSLPPGAMHIPTPTPTQSTYVSSASSRTEDEDSGHEQQQQQHHHQLQQTAGYSALHPGGAQRPASLSSRSSHLYSTIPELAVQANVFASGNPTGMPNMNPRTYFV